MSPAHFIPDLFPRLSPAPCRHFEWGKIDNATFRYFVLLMLLLRIDLIR
jgi:hypothetical protein